MSSKTSRIPIDLPKKDHQRLKLLANASGLSLKDFVLRQLDPFLRPEKVPNNSTKKAIQKIEEKEDLISCKDIDELFKKLNIEEQHGEIN